MKAIHLALLAIALCLAAAIYFIAATAAYAQGDPIPPPAGCGGPPPFKPEYVFVRQVKTPTPQYQWARDTGIPYWTDPDADLVAIDKAGNEKVLFDCDNTCAAMEPDVSPDGTRVVFVVSYLDPNKAVSAASQHKHSDIYEYKLPSGPARKVISGGRNYDPSFAANDELVYTSDWQGYYSPVNLLPPTKPLYGNYYPWPSQMVRKAKIVGDTYVPQEGNVWPHAFFVMGTEVLHDGDIMGSVLWSYNYRDYGTKANGWIPERSDGNGENSQAVANAHGTPNYTKKQWYEAVAHPTLHGGAVDQIRSLRHITQIGVDPETDQPVVAFCDYYRTNHYGGMGVCWTQTLLDGPEGVSKLKDWPYHEPANPATLDRLGSGQFVNPTLRPVTPMGLSGDTAGAQDKTNRPFGSFGYPFAVPDAHMGVAWSHGSCYVNKKETEPGECHVGLYKVRRHMVTDPYDTAQMEPLYLKAGFHARDAVWVGGTYEDLFGVQAPAPAPPLTTECFLDVVNARAGELHKLDWQSNYKPYWDATFQGNAVATGSATAEFFCTAEVGYFTAPPTQYALDTKTKVCTPLEPDGSVRHPVPCGKPYLMWGEDAQRAKVAEDSRAHSGPGKCYGCHLGHSVGMWDALQSWIGTPEQAFLGTDAYKKLLASP